MAQANNNISIHGFVGKDPVISYLPNEKIRMTFSVAVKRYDKDAEGKPKVDWINVLMWNDVAERAEKQIKGGSCVNISGSLHINEYEKEGKKVSYAYILGDAHFMINTKDE